MFFFFFFRLLKLIENTCVPTDCPQIIKIAALIKTFFLFEFDLLEMLRCCTHDDDNFSALCAFFVLFVWFLQLKDWLKRRRYPDWGIDEKSFCPVRIKCVFWLILTAGTIRGSLVVRRNKKTWRSHGGKREAADSFPRACFFVPRCYDSDDSLPPEGPLGAL